MMYNAAFGLKSTTYNNQYRSYSAYEIKNNFVKIYGPDTNYYDGDIEEVGHCQISKYDESTNSYIENTGCGGANNSTIDAVTKKYKAEQNGDYIYVYEYEYVESVLITPENENDWKSPMVVYLIGRNVTWADNPLENKETRYSVLNGANGSNYESIIEQMMDKGEVDTYKWTFKKQSDGKYYFYSGAWEN